jgi:hypothetical protein
MPSRSTPSTPRSLRIAVVGCGKIGSTFAFQLARTGHHDVTVVARPGSARLLQLQRDKGIVNVKGERASVHIMDTLDEQTPYDLIIVTVVDYQVDAVLPALQRCAAKSIQFRRRRPLLLRHAVCAGDDRQGWQAQTHDFEIPKNNHEPAALGGRVQRGGNPRSL